jgi:hypothetical protein
MGRLLRARWARLVGAAGTVLAAVALVAVVLPGPALTQLLAEATGAIAPPVEPALDRVVSTSPEVTHSQSARPWTGSKPYAGPNDAQIPKRVRKTRPTSAEFGPTRPEPPSPPADPVPPGPLEPPNRPGWIGGPTPPPCPWPLDTPMPADWYCQLEPLRDCPQYSGPSAHVLLTAVPGVRSARISWWGYGDPDVLYYRVAAIRYTARGSPNPIWQNIVVPGGCRDVGATITGLTPGERYRFMLEAVETNHAGRGVALHRGIGRSDLVRIG